MNPESGATSRSAPTNRIMLQKIFDPRCWAAAGTLLLYFGSSVWGATVNVQLTDTAGTAVQDALVMLDPLDTSPSPSHDSAAIDQISKTFVPHVSVVRTGTSISFPNSDNIRHQVYSFSRAKTFTTKLYAGSPKVGIIVDKPGLIVLGCNIHDSMAGFLAVVDTPYFGKSTAQGLVRIEVPRGHYRLRVWHEKAAKPFQAGSISIEATDLALPVTLDIVETPGIPAPWLE